MGLEGWDVQLNSAKIHRWTVRRYPWYAVPVHGREGHGEGTGLFHGTEG